MIPLLSLAISAVLTIYRGEGDQDAKGSASLSRRLGPASEAQGSIGSAGIRYVSDKPKP